MPLGKAKGAPDVEMAAILWEKFRSLFLPVLAVLGLSICFERLNGFFSLTIKWKMLILSEVIAGNS